MVSNRLKVMTPTADIERQTITGQYSGVWTRATSSCRWLRPSLIRPPELWDVDLDSYDQDGVDLVYRTSGDIRDALRPLRASDIVDGARRLSTFGGRRVSGFSLGILARL